MQIVRPALNLIIMLAKKYQEAGPLVKAIADFTLAAVAVPIVVIPNIAEMAGYDTSIAVIDAFALVAADFVGVAGVSLGLYHGIRHLKSACQNGWKSMSGTSLSL